MEQVWQVLDVSHTVRFEDVVLGSNEVQGDGGAINILMRGRTTIVVAHRLSTVRNADKIVVLDKKGIADSGTHEQLMARCERYQELVRRQLQTAPCAQDNREA